MLYPLTVCDAPRPAVTFDLPFIFIYIQGRRRGPNHALMPSTIHSIVYDPDPRRKENDMQTGFIKTMAVVWPGHGWACPARICSRRMRGWPSARRRSRLLRAEPLRCGARPVPSRHDGLEDPFHTQIDLRVAGGRHRRLRQRRHDQRRPQPAAAPAYKPFEMDELAARIGSVPPTRSGPNRGRRRSRTKRRAGWSSSAAGRKRISPRSSRGSMVWKGSATATR